MNSEKNALRAIVNSISDFIEHVAGLQLRTYQIAALEAISASVIDHQGLTFVVEMARQGGKNEMQAQLQAYLLTVFGLTGGEMVIVSPTYKPQTENAMRRLRRVLDKNQLINKLWEKESGHIFRFDGCLAAFFSGQPGANVVGATASLLLLVDEAQDISPAKYFKDFHPMTASTNATVAFFGTAWSGSTLLATEKKAALEQQALDGIQRVFVADADRIAAEVPAYGDHVRGIIARLGRQHPIVKTQYFLESIDTEGGMFPASRRALLRGRHPEADQPAENKIYAITIDVAGQDESAEGDLLREVQPRKDSTALTIAEVDLSTLTAPALMAPTYRVVKRHYWTGTKHVKLYAQIAAIAALWSPAFIVVDATGIGEPLYSFLFEMLPLSTVIGFKFTAKSKSDLGYRFLASIDSGRLVDLSAAHDHDGLASQMQREMQHCQYEIRIGPARIMSWGVPDGTRDENGTLVHDDLLIGAALFTELDSEHWPLVTDSSAVIQGQDPLAEIDQGAF
ncbi:MAG: hypothetical protein ABFS03_12335 [Chloroflexota bacterium]